MKTFIRVCDTIINVANIQRAQILGDGQVKVYMDHDWTETFGGETAAELLEELAPFIHDGTKAAAKQPIGVVNLSHFQDD
jgi:hypothetical protein